MSEFESTLKPNGYAPKSWGDIVAIATLFAMFVGLLAWGLKLESQLETLRAQQFDIRTDIGRGILPIAEERIQLINTRLVRIENDVDKLREKITVDRPLNGRVQ